MFCCALYLELPPGPGMKPGFCLTESKWFVDFKIASHSVSYSRTVLGVSATTGVGISIT